MTKEMRSNTQDYSQTPDGEVSLEKIEDELDAEIEQLGVVDAFAGRLNSNSSFIQRLLEEGYDSEALKEFYLIAVSEVSPHDFESIKLFFDDLISTPLKESIEESIIASHHEDKKLEQARDAFFKKHPSRGRRKPFSGNVGYGLEGEELEKSLQAYYETLVQNENECLKEYHGTEFYYRILVNTERLSPLAFKESFAWLVSGDTTKEDQARKSIFYHSLPTALHAVKLLRNQDKDLIKALQISEDELIGEGIAVIMEAMDRYIALQKDKGNLEEQDKKLHDINARQDRSIKDWLIHIHSLTLNKGTRIIDHAKKERDAVLETAAEKQVQEPEQERAFIEEFTKEQVAVLLDRLPAKSQRIMCLRYGLEDGREWSLVDIGKVLGISPERTRQFLEKSLATLRASTTSERLQNQGIDIQKLNKLLQSCTYEDDRVLKLYFGLNYPYKQESVEEIAALWELPQKDVQALIDKIVKQCRLS